MNLAAFRVRFPELAAASDTFVQAMLDDATLRCSASFWGTLHALGVGYLAAHMLALSPWGQSAKLIDKIGQSTYGIAYNQLLRSLPAVGIDVVL